MQVEYSRFVRHTGDTTVELRVQPDPAQPDSARVWISEEYLSALNLRQVTPEPDTWTALADGIVLSFPTAGSEPVTVQMTVRPDDLWLIRGELGVPGGGRRRSGSSSTPDAEESDMDAILRAAAVYLALLLVFRLMGKRTLAQVTAFDLILLLIVSEATQQALLGEDFSITMALLVVITLVGLERVADYLGWRFPRLADAIEGRAEVLIERGEPLADRLRQHHISMHEVLQQARMSQGLRTLDEIDYAVLERSGRISIIPKSH